MLRELSNLVSGYKKVTETNLHAEDAVSLLCDRVDSMANLQLHLRPEGEGPYCSFNHFSVEEIAGRFDEYIQHVGLYHARVTHQVFRELGGKEKHYLQTEDGFWPWKGQMLVTYESESDGSSL